MERVAGSASSLALLVVLLATSPGRSRASPEETYVLPPCNTVRFSGRVPGGQPFEHPLPGGLVFRLAPSAPPISGWVIEVRSPSLEPGESELSWVATPPFRWWNPRYLETSYGWTAERAVEDGERAFRFVQPGDLATASEAVRTLLWPADATADSLAAAQGAWDGLSVFEGRLTIRDGRVEDSPDGRGRIAALEFDVEICVPARGAP